MSTPANEVVAATKAELAQVQSRVALLESEASTFYRAHVTAILAAVCLAAGIVIGHFV